MSRIDGIWSTITQKKAQKLELPFSDHLLLVSELDSPFRFSRFLGSERYYPRKEIKVYLDSLDKFSLCMDYKEQI